MEFYLPSIAQYASILIASSMILFLIGRSVLFLLPEWRDKDNAYQTILNSFLLGYISVLPLFVIIWSRANTLFWLVVILWLFYLLWWRKPQKEDISIDWRNEGRALGITVVLLLGGFAMLYYFCFVRSEGQIFSDQIYFSNLSQSILSYHNESLFRADVSHAQPYHWGDQWTTALWAWLFQAKPLYILLCVTYPFLLAMCILGVMAVTNGIQKSTPLALCLLISILYFFQWNITSGLTPWWCGGSIAGLKNYLMIVFSIWSASYIIKGKYSQGLFALLMLVVYYSPLAAGVLTLVCLLSCFMPDRPKLTLRQLFNPYVIGSVIVAISYGLFYILQPDIFTEGAFVQPAAHSSKWVIGFIFKRICRPIAGMTPIAIVLGIYLYKTDRAKFKKYLALYICILASCFVACVVAGYALLYEIDAGQIATNFYETISHLFVYISMVYLLLELSMSYRKTAYALLIVAGIAYPTYFFYKGATSKMFPVEPMEQTQKEAFLSIQKIFDANPVRQMGYFRNYSLPENHNSPKTQYDLFFPMDRLVHILPKDYHPYCLSAYNVPDDMDSKWVDMSESELWQYGYKRKLNKPDITEGEIISAFITQTDINYIIVEKGAQLPDYLKSRFRQVYEWDTNILYYGQ